MHEQLQPHGEGLTWRWLSIVGAFQDGDHWTVKAEQEDFLEEVA